MKYNSNNKPLVCMMTQSTCYKGTSKMTIKGILWHSTGVNNPTLKRYVQPDDDAPNKEELIKIIGKNIYGNDWNHIKRQAGLNAWIGKLADGTIASVQTMPWDYKPWGCGSGSKGSCNSSHVQFEICEDGLTNKSYFDKVYKEACELTAYLCDIHNLDPHGTVNVNGVKTPVILCHADSYKLGLGSGHGDVYHWFSKYGKTMDDVRNDVASLMKQSISANTPITSPSSTSEFEEGEIVNFAGGKHYISANAIIGKTVKASKAKVIKIYKTGKHPYQLRAVDNSGSFVGGVYGWVDASVVSKIKTETTTTTTKTNKIDTIKEVQNWANINYQAGLVVDGSYGSKTKKALIKILQNELNQTYKTNLAIDGSFGSKTKAACPNLKMGAKNKVVSVLQALLICNKINGVYIDGSYGSITTDAVKSYQNKKGLVIDGVAGKDTFAKLCN